MTRFQAEEPEATSEEEEIEDVDPSEESGSEIENLPEGSTVRRGGKDKEKQTEESKIIVQTAFDAYFTYNKAGRVQTSSNVYSQLVLPLSTEEYTEAIDSVKLSIPTVEPAIIQETNRMAIFSHFMCELNEGFNIICYGIGSKRRLLNEFAANYCSKRGHVVVANGFQPEFTLKDLLNSIEYIPSIQELNLPSTAIDKQARRIHAFFAKPDQKYHIYVIIHNIDASPLRAPKAKSILALLAHNPRIHLIASIDHINAPLLWSSSEAFSRKAENNTNDSRGFQWLWHDLTTLVPYDFELTFADRSSLSGAHAGGPRRKADTISAQNSTAMSETAASHILASVTQKAQKLFSLLGNYQLQAIEGADDGASNDLQQFGMVYDMLFNNARDNFIATSDTALRSLLGEFRDHSLVVSAHATAGGGEVLWIPMRKERLANVLLSLNATI